MRAKFYLRQLTEFPGQTAQINIELAPVTRGDRNADWAAATPSGKIEMTITNPAACDWVRAFMASARATNRPPELLIDLNPATQGWPGDGHPYRESDAPVGHYQYGVCGDCGMAKDGDIPAYLGITGKLHPSD